MVFYLVRALLIWFFLIIGIIYLSIYSFRFFLSEGFSKGQIVSAFILFLALIITYYVLGIKKKQNN
ncbi:MAG: hypothetical protein AABW41_02765 [Nanoarchaeota archaeon]